MSSADHPFTSVLRPETLSIRPLSQDDYQQWLPLWDGNNLGHRNEAVTAETWRRLMDPHYPVFGLGAYEEKKLTGILHYVLHPTTGGIQPVCYLQDLYVDPAFRRKGIARALILEVADIGKKAKWTRIYWLSEKNNEAARNLYKNIGIGVDNFTLHVLPTGEV